MSTENIVVLGTGMAGFGAAYRLHAEGIAPVMFDKNAYHGGHTTSFRYESGFLFDVGPHISFTKDSRIQELFADSVNQQYETIQINLNNYWRGYWPQHPVQLHLHGLPEDDHRQDRSPTSSKSARRPSARSTTTETGWSPASAVPSPKCSR